MKYSELIKKWGEDKVTEAQEILADENELYQHIEGQFIELDEQGKGKTTFAARLEEKLLAMVDNYLTKRNSLITNDEIKGLFE